MRKCSESASDVAAPILTRPAAMARQLVEHPPRHAQCPGGVPDRGERQHAEVMLRRTAMHHGSEEVEGLVVRHPHAVQPVVDGLGGPQPDDIPVAPRLDLTGRIAAEQVRRISPTGRRRHEAGATEIGDRDARAELVTAGHDPVVAIPLGSAIGSELPPMRGDPRRTPPRRHHRRGMPRSRRERHRRRTGTSRWTRRPERSRPTRRRPRPGADRHHRPRGARRSRTARRREWRSAPTDRTTRRAVRLSRRRRSWRKVQSRSRQRSCRHRGSQMTNGMSRSVDSWYLS